MARDEARAGSETGDEPVDVLIVGAGPCGLAAAIAAQRAGLSALIVERGCLVSGIASYPTYMTFFSTAERLAIGDVPFPVATEKPTRRDALVYYRTVAAHFGVRVRQYETAERIERCDGAARAPREPNAGGLAPRFVVHSRRRTGQERAVRAHAVVIATGYFGHPNALGVPGETLPHVTHLFTEGHEAWELPVVVVGGGNSAVDAALDLYRAGAHVSLVHFLPTVDRNIKPWVLPDITNRLADGSIRGLFEARVTAIEPDAVVVSTPTGTERVPAEKVYLMLGYQPNNELLLQLGVPLDAATGVPAHDPGTMETSVPGVFIAGVLASGYDANKTFIENGRFHGNLIAASLVAGTRAG